MTTDERSDLSKDISNGWRKCLVCHEPKLSRKGRSECNYRELNEDDKSEWEDERNAFVDFNE